MIRRIRSLLNEIRTYTYLIAAASPARSAALRTQAPPPPRAPGLGFRKRALARPAHPARELRVPIYIDTSTRGRAHEQD